ncbi:MAG: hypothetical protein AMJ94_05650 [Deltaproteobacteria bacterium SM23_61]|nr:MAG: hypothetical protein AMJ94_05650 [Deltaproteobacteria bacterium SM23_61]
MLQNLQSFGRCQGEHPADEGYINAAFAVERLAYGGRASQSILEVPILFHVVSGAGKRLVIERACQIIYKTNGKIKMKGVERGQKGVKSALDS